MKIKKLKEIIKDLPDNMDVFVSERLTEYEFGLVNSALVKEIKFYDKDDPDNEDLQAKDTVLILTED